MTDICLGMQTSGKPYYTTFEDCRHLMICGYSGSGKTTLVYHILEQLNNVKTYVFDIMRIYFKDYIGKQNITIAKDDDKIKLCLKEISQEIDKRINQYNYNAQPIVVVVDSYNACDFMNSFDMLPYLEKFAYAEKVGVHIIITTTHTKQPREFKNIMLNSSIISTSADYRKLYLNCDKKLFPNNCNILAKIIGENQLVELLPKQFPFISKIQNNN